MKASADSIRATINEPFKARLLRALWQLIGRKSRLDQFFSTFLKHRRYLPECDAQKVIPRFSRTDVRNQDGYFIGLNGVPEALGIFFKTYSIRGTRLAIYSNREDWNRARSDESVLEKIPNTVWDEKQLRG